MASILIGTLSTALLLGGVMAASSIDRDVKALDEAYYTALSAAERQTAPLPEGPFQLKIENKGSGTARNFPIHLYGGSGTPPRSRAVDSVPMRMEAISSTKVSPRAFFSFFFTAPPG